jgi:hypothetical protein
MLTQNEVEGMRFVDFVAADLKRDISHLLDVGIKLDKGELAAKTGGVAWAGFEAVTGDLLSALVIGGIAMLSGNLTNCYKRFEVGKVRKKWIDRLSDMSEDDLAYLEAGLRRKYPALLRSYQNLLQAGEY